MLYHVCIQPYLCTWKLSLKSCFLCRFEYHLESLGGFRKYFNVFLFFVLQKWYSGECQVMGSFIREDKSICKGKRQDRHCLKLYSEDKALNVFFFSKYLKCFDNLKCIFLAFLFCAGFFKKLYHLLFVLSEKLVPIILISSTWNF